MICGATNVRWVLLGLFAIALFGGTDSFSFTSEPSNPTYLTKGMVGNLTWEYVAGAGKTVHDRIFILKNNVKMGYVDKLEAGITRNIYEPYRGSYDIASSFNPVTLIFKSPMDSATHDGEYAVDIQIEETGEQVVSRAAINVIDPPTVTISNAKVSAVTGSTAVLTANFSVPSEVSHEKKWTFQAQGSSSSREVGQGDSLNLPNVRSNQTGNYTITVSNQYGGRASATVELQVNSLPTTTLTASKASACVNATVTLTCSATGYPAASEFVLYLGSHELERNSNGSFSVILKTPGSAEYRCSAKNEYGASANASVTITAKEPVKITDFPASILVVNGSMATLNCSASGNGAINITITKQGSSQSWSGGVVTFSPVSAADQARYNCTARGGASECPAVTKNAVVIVTGLPAPNTSLNVTSPTTCLGDIMELKCASTALSVEQYILEASGMGQMTSLTGDFRVTLTEPGNKEYRCHPLVRGVKLPNATVVVNVPDVMASSQIAQIVTEGSNVTLECDAGINKTVSWRKVGQAKYPVGGIREFAPVTLADGGLYHCVTEHARECAALATKTVNIQVNSIGSVPPNITTSFKNMIFKENATVRLTCQATGNPAPDVYWTMDRRRIGGSNTLELKASADNMGVYECVAANGAAPDAKASVTLELHVPALCPSDFCSNDGKCISSDSCDKNGACADRRTSFECECKLGWSRPQCKKIDEVDMVFVGSFKLSGIAWRESYANSATESYKNITAEIRQAIDKAYENMPIFVRSKVLNLRKGSVIVDFELSFNETTSRDKALEPLQNVALTGSLGKYGINGSTITLQAASAVDPCNSFPCLHDGTCTRTGNGFECLCKNFRYGPLCQDGIDVLPMVVIILALLILLIIVTVLVLYYCRMSRKAKYSTGFEEDGEKRSTNDSNKTNTKEKHSTKERQKTKERTSTKERDTNKKCDSTKRDLTKRDSTKRDSTKRRVVTMERVVFTNNGTTDHAMAVSNDPDLRDETGDEEEEASIPPSPPVLWSEKYAQKSDDKDKTRLVTANNSPVNSDETPPPRQGEYAEVTVVFKEPRYFDEIGETDTDTDTSKIPIYAVPNKSNARGQRHPFHRGRDPEGVEGFLGLPHSHGRPTVVPWPSGLPPEVPGIVAHSNAADQYVRDFNDETVYTLSTSDDPRSIKRSQSLNRKVHFELEGRDVEFTQVHKTASLKRDYKVGTL